MITDVARTDVVIVSDRNSFATALRDFTDRDGASTNTEAISHRCFAETVSRSTVPGELVLIDLKTPSDAIFRGAFDAIARRLPVTFAFVVDPQSRRCCAALFDLICRFSAVGCLSALESPQNLANALHRVLGGYPQVAHEFLGEISADMQTRLLTLNGSSAFEGLTMRQLEVLTLLAEGASVQSVARTLHLSSKTIESHKYRLMKELSIDNSVSLCRFAIRNGLVEP